MNLTLDAVDLPTGVRLPYAEQGDPDGIPLLLIHGWTDSHRSFEPLLPHLPASIRAIAVTLPGHGDADRPLAGYEIPALAGDMIAFMDALGIARAVVLGHSLGAWVAQQVALDEPGRVLGAVLVGALGAPARNPVMPALHAELLDLLTEPVEEETARAFQLSTTEQPLAPEQLDVFVAESLKVPRRVWRATYEAFMQVDLVDRLPALAAPTLLLWGDRDQLATRAEQDLLARTIPRAHLLVYRGTGHAIHWEEPERVAADVAAFAEEVR